MGVPAQSEVWGWILSGSQDEGGVQGHSNKVCGLREDVSQT